MFSLEESAFEANTADSANCPKTRRLFVKVNAEVRIHVIVRFQYVMIMVTS